MMAFYDFSFSWVMQKHGIQFFTGWGAISDFKLVFKINF
jgi:hypothetical protein